MRIVWKGNIDKDELISSWVAPDLWINYYQTPATCPEPRANAEEHEKTKFQKSFQTPMIHHSLTCAWRPISKISWFTSAAKTAISVSTHCLCVTFVRATSTFIHICSDNEDRRRKQIVFTHCEWHHSRQNMLVRIHWLNTVLRYQFANHNVRRSATATGMRYLCLAWSVWEWQGGGGASLFCSLKVVLSAISFLLQISSFSARL